MITTAPAAAAVPVVGPTLDRYCFDCHAGESAAAGVDLERLLRQTPFVKRRDEWGRVMRAIEFGAMPPPEDGPRMASRVRDRLVASLTSELRDFDYTRVDDPGFEPARRLTKREYGNTVRDLLGIELDVEAKFPRELAGGTGFDNAASGLSLQPALMERYLAAAERAIATAFPDGGPSPATRRAVFGGPIPRDDATAEAALLRFLKRAHRRPPAAADGRRLLARYQKARSAGRGVPDAFREAVVPVLISPRFLVRAEAEGRDDALDAWSLASRLSYFLWSTMPDEELFRLAESGALARPDVLAAQARRLLADPRAERFAKTFVGQWLSTRLIGREVRRDPIDEPWCTDTLMDAMRDEPALVFLSVFREGRPLTDLIEADFTYMNEELARTIYGLRKVRGAEMRRVSLRGSQRRGLVTSPAVLAVTSHRETTSPVKRGAFVLERILGTPPPPPPPGADEFSDQFEDHSELSGTDRLRRHARDASCRSCHAKIDPLGLTLENYAAFGRWRTRYDRDRPVDAEATLKDGRPLDGPAGLRGYLTGPRRDDLVRNVTVRVLEYALGRETEYFDEPAIRDIVARLEGDGLAAASLIEAVVRSRPFRFRRAPDAAIARLGGDAR